MKFIKRKLRNWLLNDSDNCEVEGSRKAVSIRDSIESEPTINFRIYAAQNGQIIEFSKYDYMKDQGQRSIYIVNKDEDLGEKVAKCLSLEMLR